MKIQKIKINNFKSIRGDFELDFENRIHGMWKLVGPVGSGKTTIGEAIIFGLFGTIKDKTNDSLISWGEKHSTVELWCVCKNKHIYIKREINSYGQSPIYVTINGEDLVYTDKRDIQSQLEKEYYDISKTTVELLCIISFNNFKSLASLNVQDARKFLDNVLGFAALTKYIDIGKQFKNENLLLINNIQSKINQCQAQIDKINELANKSKIEGDINEINKEIQLLNTQIADYKKSYENELKVIKEDINNYISELSSIKALGVNKAKEISLIKKGTCPTCGAKIDQSILPIKEEERNVLLNQYKIVDEKLKNEQSKQEKTKTDYNQTIEPLKKQIEECKFLLIKLQEQQKRVLINTNEIDKIETQLKGHTIDLQNLQNEDHQWSLLLDMLGSEIRSKILSAFIPVLNENIMKYSQRLRQPYIIQFDEQFKCIIKLLGWDQEISVKSLSTGQLKTVDMIIILSVLGTIMNNNSLNITFLDELFSNMHSELRNEMCLILRENMKDGDTIFTVSHYEINEGFYDGTINVQLEPIDQYRQKTKIEIFENN